MSIVAEGRRRFRRVEAPESKDIDTGISSPAQR
jgi:hypothetical protein